MQADRTAGLLPADTNRPLTLAEVQTLFGGQIPYSHCQPYFRVTNPASTKEELELKMVDDAAKRKREVEELGAIGERDLSCMRVAGVSLHSYLP